MPRCCSYKRYAPSSGRRLASFPPPSPLSLFLFLPFSLPPSIPLPPLRPFQYPTIISFTFSPSMPHPTDTSPPHSWPRAALTCTPWLRHKPTCGGGSARQARNRPSRVGRQRGGHLGKWLSWGASLPHRACCPATFLGRGERGFTLQQHTVRTSGSLGCALGSGTNCLLNTGYYRIFSR